MEPLTGREIRQLLGAGLLGVVIGVVGTGIHRSTVPWGLLLALLTVFAGAVLVRAWIGWIGMLALAMGVVTTVGVLGQSGPGGDVLIAADAIGYLWYAGALVVGLAGLLPSRWFSREPLRRDGPVAADP